MKTMYKYSITFLLVLIISSCVFKEKSIEEDVLKIHKSLNKYIPIDSNQLYYPLNSNYFISDSTDMHGDSSVKKMYSDILYNLNEPILYNYHDNPKLEFIRFLWIRPFDDPVVIRLNKMQNIISANIKELGTEFSGNGDFTYKLTIDTIILVKELQWEKIFNSLYKEHFWRQKSMSSLGNYKDATLWILECRFKNEYHCINQIYINKSSFQNFEYAKKLFKFGSNFLNMENSREYNTK